MKYCENCGAQLEDDAVFCGKCGHKVGKKSNEAVNTNDIESKNTSNTISTNSGLDKSSKKKSPLIPILCGIIGVLVVVVIIMVVVINKKTDDSSNGKNEQIINSSSKSIEETTSGNKEETTVKSTEATTQANNWKKQYIEYLKNVDSKNYGGCEYIYMNNDDIPELMILGSNTAAGNILVTSDNTTIDSKNIDSGKMYYAEKSNELDIESGRQGVYVYKIYKIIDGKIKEEEANSFDTSGKTAFVYNRPKTIQQIIDDLSGETANESITEKQTESKFDAKTLDNKSWSSKFITKNGYTYCVSMRINSVQSDIEISELIIKCYKENSDSGFIDKLVNIPIKVTDNKLEFDVSKAEQYYTESGDLDETKEFKPLDSLKDNYKGVFQITFTSGNDNLTVVSGNIYCGKTYMDFSGASLESSVH